MDISIVEIILIILMAAFVIFLCILISKSLLRHIIVGSIVIVIFTITGFVMSFEITKALSNMFTSEFTRSEVTDTYDILDIKYESDYIYLTYIDNDGKIITERNNIVVIHKNAEKNYFVNNECKRSFIYWDKWDIYLKGEN